MSDEAATADVADLKDEDFGDVYEVEEYMGVERVVFGSDWPHIEGMPEPLDYLAEISKFDDAKKLRILRDNVRELNELRPA